MTLRDKRIGFAVTGSFCTFDQILPPMKNLVDQGAKVIPIFSNNAYAWDTRFFKAEDFIRTVEEITGKHPIHTIVDTEPIGPKKLLDMVILAPCTGNSASKLAFGIIDTPALMAAKSQLRNGGPLVIAISTNDGLSNNAKSIGLLQNMKNIYFVPYEQDNAHAKPMSLVARMSLIPEACEKALDGVQMQPMLIMPG